MNKQLMLIIILLLGIVTQAQQPPTNLVETEVITTENIANLQLITTLGDGRLIALDWHRDGEVLALARGSGLCLLDAQLEITECFYETGAVYDLAWDSMGTRLALISDSGLHIWIYDALNQSFTISETIHIDGNCVAWNTDEEIVIGEFFYESRIARKALYQLTTDELVLLREFDDTDNYVELLQSQCRADTDDAETTIMIESRYSMGRTYDYIQNGVEWSDTFLSERTGSIADVSWHIPNETFTYIVGNEIVDFSIELYLENSVTGDILRSAVVGTSDVNILRWSPDGNQLLSGLSYNDIFNVWSNETNFISGDVSRQEIDFVIGIGSEALIKWIDNTHISYEVSDWYQGSWWDVLIIDSETGERAYSISMFIPFQGATRPLFQWNPSYTAYMIFTDEGLKITRLLEEPERISYNTETGDFDIDVARNDYLFTDISCDGYGWIDDRYFSCIGQDEETIIDSFTGDISVEPLTIEVENTSFYDLETNNDTGVVNIIDTVTGNTTINLNLPNLHPQSFRVQSFPASGLMTWYQDEGIRFWDVPSGEELLFLDNPSITAMALHPDGHILAVATSSGLVYLYGVPLSDE